MILNDQLKSWTDQYMKALEPNLNKGRALGRNIILIGALAALLLFGGGAYLMTKTINGFIMGAVFAAILIVLCAPILLLSFSQSYSPKRVRSLVEGMLQKLLPSDEEQALFAAEMLGESKKLIQYAPHAKQSATNTYIVLTEHFLVHLHDKFFSVVSLDHLDYFYQDQDLSTVRAMYSNARVSAAVYSIAFAMKEPAALDWQPPFVFQDKKQMLCAYDQLKAIIPQFVR